MAQQDFESFKKQARQLETQLNTQLGTRLSGKALCQSSLATRFNPHDNYQI